MLEFPTETIAGPNDLLLVTGANGFIGSRVVRTLAEYGFRNLRCFVRLSSNLDNLHALIKPFPEMKVEWVQGNLLSRDDCGRAADGVSVAFHLAAGIEKTFAGAFLNSVVASRNLVEALLDSGSLKRFVNVSSLAVYSNYSVKRGSLLDESSPIETHLTERHEAYTFAKAKQDELIGKYGRSRGLPYVIVRPGAVFGPGKRAITARVGIDTFGVFLHLGAGNSIPLTYVDNCAEAIVLAGIKKGIDGEVFNIVDDDLPTSREFLRFYKKEVGPFKSLYIPYPVLSLLCRLWEKYSSWSDGQVPPAFNRWRCCAYWKGNVYSNRKLKERLGWKPRVSLIDGLGEYTKFLKHEGAGQR